MPQGYTVIRPARYSDVGEIIEISRASFPFVFVRRTRKWWTLAMDSSSCEIWMLEVDGHVAGFVVLVEDVVAYDALMKKCKACVPYIFLTLIQSPRVSFEKIVNKVRWMIGHNRKRGKQVKGRLQKSLWVKPIALYPKFRSQGLGSKLMAFCQQRAGEMGAQSLKLMVEGKNVRAMKFYKGVGFGMTSRGVYGDIYEKVL